MRKKHKYFGMKHQTSQVKIQDFRKNKIKSKNVKLKQRKLSPKKKLKKNSGNLAVTLFPGELFVVEASDFPAFVNVKAVPFELLSRSSTMGADAHLPSETVLAKDWIFYDAFKWGAQN